MQLFRQTYAVATGLWAALFCAGVEWFPAQNAAHVREDGGVTPPHARRAPAMVTPAYLPPDGPTNPMGVARGVVPGRVAWVYDQRATAWNGSSTQFWADAQVTDVATVHAMLSQALCRLTGAASAAAAWDALFRQFNGTNNHGYLSGENVVIKANLVNHANYPSKSNLAMVTPQAIYALLDQLVTQAGVPQTNITVYESLLRIGDQVWNLCHAAFPDVHYADGYGLYGRELCVKDSNFPIRTSNGVVVEYPPTCVTAARYMINLATLKSHEPAHPAWSDAFFVSLCAKNHFGSLCGSAQAFHPYIEATNAYASYHILPDLMEHQQLGGKTMLYLLDGLYGGLGAWNALPERWQMAPFNNDWPSSLLLSADGVALDSVGTDFLQYERELRNDPMRGSVDSYLHEAAQITNPPSGMVYDPDTNGSPARSLGVHEHWANPRDKAYSRNFDANLVNGIELTAILLPAEPLVEYLAWSLVEQGNSNGVCEPGESAALQVVLRNSSPVGDLSNAVLTLSAPAGLVLSNAAWAVGALPHMTRATNAAPFIIDISTNCAAGIHLLDSVVAGDGCVFSGACALTVAYVPYPRVSATNLALVLEGTPVTGAALVLSNRGIGALNFDVLVNHGGPTNYTWRDSDMPGGPAFAWIDISGSGDLVTLHGGGDEGRSSMLPIGFDFPFYGQLRTAGCVSANGVLAFADGSVSFNNTSLPCPAWSAPGPLLAPFWDDLDLATDGVIRTALVDGARVVSWLNVRRYATLERQAFQTILKPDGAIVFQYLAVTATLTSATIGMQASNAPAPAVQVAYNQTYLHNALALQFSSANADWLNVSPAHGTVSAQCATSLWVSADGTSLTAGVYRSSACVVHNGTDPPIDISVELIVPEPWLVAMLVCSIVAGVRRSVTRAHSFPRADPSDPPAQNSPHTQEQP